MSRDLIVSRVPGELRAALLVDDRATELRICREDEPGLVGALFSGRVVRVLPAVPAAFVDLGAGRQGFLPRITTRAGARLVEGAALAVEVVKDAYGDKGPELREANVVAGGTAKERLDKPKPLLHAAIDEFRPLLDRLIVDNRSDAAEARRYIGGDLPAVTFDGDPDFDERTGLQAAFDEAITPLVRLAGGGRVILDPSAAFTAIDVDLGAAAGGRGTMAAAILATNLEAAHAIARHLRLRNIGGAIVVDMISMTRKGDRQAIERAFREAISNDPLPVEFHGWTRLGHVELTRRRSGRPIADYLLAPPNRRRLPEAVGWAALRALLIQKVAGGGWRLRIHPTVAAELAGRLKPWLSSVRSQVALPIELEPDPGLDPDLFDIRPRLRH